jgi:biotin operon repressor
MMMMMMMINVLRIGKESVISGNQLGERMEMVNSAIL